MGLYSSIDDCNPSGREELENNNLEMPLTCTRKFRCVRMCLRKPHILSRPLARICCSMASSTMQVPVLPTPALEGTTVCHVVSTTMMDAFKRRLYKFMESEVKQGQLYRNCLLQAYCPLVDSLCLTLGLSLLLCDKFTFQNLRNKTFNEAVNLYIFKIPLLKLISVPAVNYNWTCIFWVGCSRFPDEGEDWQGVVRGAMVWPVCVVILVQHTLSPTRFLTLNLKDGQVSE